METTGTIPDPDLGPSETNPLFTMFDGWLTGKRSHATIVGDLLGPKQKSQNPEVALEEDIRKASTPAELLLSRITYERQSGVQLEQNAHLHELYNEKSVKIIVQGLPSSSQNTSENPHDSEMLSESSTVSSPT